MSSMIKLWWRVDVIAVLLSFVLLADLRLEAQAPTDWRRLPMPENRADHGMAIDPASGALIVHGRSNSFGSGFADTWLWRAGEWRQPASWCTYHGVPPTSANQPLLADVAQGRVLLVAYEDRASPVAHREYTVWQFQHGCWSLLWRTGTANTCPEPMAAGFAFDDARGCIVAFGSSSLGSGGNQTWEWRSSGWSRCAPATAPSPRTDAAMTYDRARRRTVLFGGAGSNETWEYDGSTWQQRFTAVTPPARNRGWLSCDDANARLMLAGGFDAQGPATDLWSLDAAGWTQVATGAPARVGAAYAYDNRRQRLLCMGGDDVHCARSDLWEWDSFRWQQVDGTAAPIEPRLVTDYARGRVLALEADGVWWQRANDGWVRMSVTGAVPGARNTPALGYDASRGRTVLFGGDVNFTQLLGDTWEWAGVAWTQLQPQQSPTPRSGAGLVGDIAGGALLFGGRTTTGFNDETWRFDGVTWTQLHPSSVPRARAEPQLVLDPQRGVLLLGGIDGNGAFLDQWHWDGSQWQGMTPAVWPSAGLLLPVHDPVRGTITACVQVPGDLHQLPPVMPATEVWDWDGSAWRRVDPVSPLAQVAPLGYIEASSFGFDPQSGRCVAIGDCTNEFGAVQVGATARDLGDGCAGAPATLWMGPLYLGEAASVGMQGPIGMQAPALLMFGLSDVAWRGALLPLDLGGVGASGCRLLVAADVVMVVGESSFGFGPDGALEVAMLPQLAGVQLCVQGAYLWPQANAAGLLLTNGIGQRLGLR